MSLDPYATAAELGLMVGFPPPPDKRVNRANALMQPPFNRWAYQNMRTIYPSSPIATSSTPVPIAITPDPAIEQLSIPRPDGSDVDFATFLRETYTDALVVATPDGIVHESYLNGMTPYQPHQMMSATKSFAGLFGLMVAADGLTSEDESVIEVVPELAAASAFAEASFGQVLDMTNSMAFDEVYSDPDSAIIKYGQALGWMEAPPGTVVADSLYDYLITLEKNPDLEHGELFHYQTPKTDVVNWVNNRATGRSFQDQMSRDLWEPLGTEGETYVLLDRNGTLVAGGGLNACARDLARFATMMLASGSYNGRQVVPTAVVDQLATGGDVDAFSRGPEAEGFQAGGDWSYRAMWWIRHTPGHAAFMALGIHGQWIYIDRERQVAVVKQSSQPVSKDMESDHFVLNAIDAIIGHVAA